MQEPPKESPEKKALREKLELAKKEGLMTKIFFFVPNIVGYIRITCLIIAFWHLKSDYRIFMAFYIASYILDQVDGMAARHFKQCIYWLTTWNRQQIWSHAGHAHRQMCHRFALDYVRLLGHSLVWILFVYGAY